MDNVIQFPTASATDARVAALQHFWARATNDQELPYYFTRDVLALLDHEHLSPAQVRRAIETSVAHPSVCAANRWSFVVRQCQLAAQLESLGVSPGTVRPRRSRRYYLIRTLVRVCFGTTLGVAVTEFALAVAHRR